MKPWFCSPEPSHPVQQNLQSTGPNKPRNHFNRSNSNEMFWCCGREGGVAPQARRVEVHHMKNSFSSVLRPMTTWSEPGGSPVTPPPPLPVDHMTSRVSDSAPLTDAGGPLASPGSTRSSCRLHGDEEGAHGDALPGPGGGVRLQRT